MTRTPKLNDIQLILLSTAIQSADGSLMPPPASLADQAARVRKAVPPMLKRELVAEADVAEENRSWRKDGERFLGLFITAAGRLAIGAEPEVAPAPEAAEQPEVPSSRSLAPAAVKRTSKSDEVLAMLRRPDGATLTELVTATGWLPHTTRAALTGLRKKGHAIERGKRGDSTCYSVALAA